MNLLGRLALTLALKNSSGCILTKPINCYILEGIVSTQIIIYWPDLVTHFVDLFIDLIKSANKHIDAINMISLTNHKDTLPVQHQLPRSQAMLIHLCTYPATMKILMLHMQMYLKTCQPLLVTKISKTSPRQQYQQYSMTY